MTQTTAIHPDADPNTQPQEAPPWDEANPSPQPHADARLEALNRIAAHNQEQDRAQQDNPIETQPSPPTHQEETPGEGDQNPVEVNQNEALSTQEEPPVPDSQLVPVTIDGKTEMVPLKNVIKGYQIESAARKRLGEAASLFKQLRKREEELKQYSPLQATERPTQDGANTRTEITPEAMQAYVDQTPSATPPTPESNHPEEVANYVFMRQEIRSEKDRLMQSQPHIARDAHLVGMHARTVLEAMQTHPGLPVREYFDHATQSINQWLTHLSPPLTRSNTPGQRLADKREATQKQAPSGIHQKVPSGTDAPPSPTFGDKIRQMKESRGLI